MPSLVHVCLQTMTPGRARLPRELSSVPRETLPQRDQNHCHFAPRTFSSGRSMGQRALSCMVHGGGARVANAHGVWSRRRAGV